MPPIPMPFRRSARIVLTNESAKDVDPRLLRHRLHARRSAAERRSTSTPTGTVSVRRRSARRSGFCRGSRAAADISAPTIGVITIRPTRRRGGAKARFAVNLDGDAAHATLVGTGTEDAIGSGWGQGAFATATRARSSPTRHAALVVLPAARAGAIFFESAMRGLAAADRRRGEEGRCAALRGRRRRAEPQSPSTPETARASRSSSTPSGPPALGAAALDTDWMNFYRATMCRRRPTSIWIARIGSAADATSRRARGRTEVAAKPRENRHGDTEHTEDFRGVPSVSRVSQVTRACWTRAVADPKNSSASSVSPWPPWQFAANVRGDRGSVQRVRCGQRERRDHGVELLAVRRHHLIGAVHRAHCGPQRAVAGVLEHAPGSSSAVRRRRRGRARARRGRRRR